MHMMVGISKEYGVEAVVLKNSSFKAVDFCDFVCKIADKNNNFVVFCDNASIHKCILAKRAIELRGVRIIYNLVRTPDLNCIEKLFRAVKLVYRRRRLQSIIDGRIKNPKVLVREVFQDLDPTIPKKLCEHGLNQWHEDCR